MDTPDDEDLGPSARPNEPAGILPATRREFLVGAGGTGLLAITPARSSAQQAAADARPQTGAVAAVMHINGTRHEVSFDGRASLLDVLRERVGLTGAKKGCDHGQCGACTVHADGRRVVSCLTPAQQATGKQIVTIEGIAPAGAPLHPMQQAFIDHDALQCGYCTPGQIMSAIACVNEGHAGSADQIREYMSGNICRCGAYAGILAAVQDAARKMKRGPTT